MNRFCIVPAKFNRSSFLTPLIYSCRDHESGGHVGYPMSTFTSQLANYELSYEALEGACHFNDAYHRKLISKYIRSLTVSTRNVCNSIYPQLHYTTTSMNRQCVRVIIRSTICEHFCDDLRFVFNLAGLYTFTYC